MPPWLAGFCVAMTKNGSGKGRVAPSMVTWPSSIASSKALWLFGVARLISSASTSSAKIGPGWKTNCPLSLSNTEVPRISPGSRSEVNWMRWKLSPSTRARAWLRVVLPIPGRSSINRCPRASRQARARRTWRSLPRRISSTAFRQASRVFSIPTSRFRGKQRSYWPEASRQGTCNFSSRNCETVATGTCRSARYKPRRWGGTGAPLGAGADDACAMSGSTRRATVTDGRRGGSRLSPVRRRSPPAPWPGRRPG